MLTTPGQYADAADDISQTKFRRIPTQFIAALGDPGATSGNGAETWGLWRLDPGPRGVWLKDYRQLQAAGAVVPAQWKFDNADWWLDENGIVLEKPAFPIPPGKYAVTGGREVVTVLAVYPEDENGNRRWELYDGATLYDITHLPCRSARYTPETNDSSCSPAKAQKTAFPVDLGGPMPPVEGCNKQDYSVLFVIAVAAED